MQASQLNKCLKKLTKVFACVTNPPGHSIGPFDLLQSLLQKASKNWTSELLCQQTALVFSETYSYAATQLHPPLHRSCPKCKGVLGVVERLNRCRNDQSLEPGAMLGFLAPKSLLLALSGKKTTSVFFLGGGAFAC